jgi:hypothetical protein
MSKPVITKPKTTPVAAPPAASASAGKSVIHVQLTDDGHHDAVKVKKVLTTKYNMEQLKKITEFDSWVDEELDKLCAGKGNVELDFDEWDMCEPGKRKMYLETKLVVVGDTPARRKFIDEYNKRGAVVQNMLHDPSLKRTASGSRLAG